MFPNPKGLCVLTLALAAAISHNPESVQSPSAQQPPEAEISNGLIRAKLYLPDAERGFYRSTRFDWSGIVGSLEFNGHQYYRPWFTGTDPSVRDFIYKDADIIASAQSAIVGPVEEFQRPQGYNTAKPGETFVKIGVGVLRKPDDSNYSPYGHYTIVDPGKWSVTKQKDAVEFVQELNDPASGYGYLYRKAVRAIAGRPELVIEHSLRNTGKVALQTNQYNHNFLVLDGAATGPGFTITLPFQIQTAKPPDPKDAEIRGNKIVYLRTLEGQERVTFGIQGFGKEPKDYDVRVENAKTGVGFRVTSDRPLASMNLWSIRSVISLEPFVDVSTEPGATTTWKLTYHYFAASK
jgi:hypothetical protein